MIKKILGIVLPMGQNRVLLKKSGQWTLWESEIELYKKDFAEVIIFEYRYCDWRRFFETVFYPFLHAREFKTCAVLKAVHLTGTVPCLIAKWLYNIPYALSYGYRYDKFAKLEKKWFQYCLFKLLTPIAVKYVSAVMAPTEGLKAYIEKYKPKKITVIPNGVDLKKYKKVQKSTKKYKKEIKILFVGRLERQKNLEILIKAIKKLPQTSKGVRLIFVGSGSLKEKLIKLAGELNVSLEIINSVSNNQLPKIYRQADIFVLPSLVEGHPKALLEAMACGLPCIVSDIAGCREIITDNEDGLLIQSTVEGISSALEELIRDSQLKQELGRKARDTVERTFDKRKLIKKEINLLQSLIY